MAGRTRLDVLEEKIEALRDRCAGDELGRWVATLSCETIAEIEQRIVAGEPPETVMQEVMQRDKD